MPTKFLSGFGTLLKNRSLLVLSVVWCLSFLTGAHFAAKCRYIAAPLLRLCFMDNPNALFLFFIQLLPLLLITIAILMAINWIPFLILAIYGFVFSFCLSSLLLFCHSGGWLICLIHMFSFINSAAPLLWYTGKHVACSNSALKRDFWVCLFVTLSSCSIDVFLISPFANSLAPIL